DGWSVGLLLSELDAGYRGATLDPLPARYADFVHARATTAPEWPGRLAWWRDRLAGAGTDVAPLGDLPANHRPSGPAGVLTFALPPALTAAVREFSRAAETTPYVTLLAAFGAVLHRYCDCGDLLVGTPLMDRGRADFQPLIGMFVN